MSHFATPLHVSTFLSCIHVNVRYSLVSHIH